MDRDMSAAPDLKPVPSKPIRLLLFCALGAFVFTTAGGLFVFLNTQHFESRSEWLSHTHEVIEILQQESGRLDRAEYNLELFRSTKNDTYDRNALAAMVQMNDVLLQLQFQVRDNPSQTRHAQELGVALALLSKAVEASQQTAAVPGHELRECRSDVNTMQNEERTLLLQRTKEFSTTLLRNYLWGAVYVFLSLALLVAVFFLLIRDALSRRASEQRLSLANSNLACSLTAIEERVGEAALVKNARDELQLCTSAKQAYDCAARHFQQLVPGSSGATMIMNNSRTVLMMNSSWNDPPGLLEGFDIDGCCALRAGRPRWRRPGESEIHCGHFLANAPENYICLPLAGLGDTMGIVFINLPTPEAVQTAEERLPVIYELVELVAMATAGLNLRAELEDQSIRDVLTNLFNRRFMEVALERELQRAVRSGSCLALLMLDVDHFKDFNDAYGHEAGDLILRNLSGCLQSAVRSEDLVCRYGGEEFVIILPDITEELALGRAEAIREAVLDLRMQFSGEPVRRISVSVGVAIYPYPAKNAIELLRLADRGLYLAKDAGRNQVKILAA